MITVPKSMIMALLACIICCSGRISSADEGDYVCDGNVLWRFIDGALVNAGKLLVSDDFTKKDDAKWDYKGVSHTFELKDGEIVSASYGMALPMKQIPEGGFVLTVKVKPIATEPEKGGGFAGISVSGILFTLQPGRYWWQWKTPGDARGSGSWKDEKVPFDTWYDFKIVGHPGGAFEWFVNGRKLCSILEPELKGGIVLQAWRVKVAYRDLKLYGIDKTKEDSGTGENINRIQNSSFEEFDDNLPPFWVPFRLRDIPFTYGSMENFYRNWHLDSNEKYEGKQSLFMGSRAKNGTRTYFCSVPKGDAVLSMYMKSNVDSLPVQVFLNGIPEAKTTFKVGREWQRYSLPFNNKSQSRCWIYVVPDSSGSLWLDAVQLEGGKVATAYRPNPLDTKKSRVNNDDKADFPVSRIARIRQAPQIDGQLNDPVWQEAGKAPPFRIPDEIPGKFNDPKETTEAYLCHDDKNLYIGIKCNDSKMMEIKEQARENNSSVAGGECVEIFIDTDNDRQTFYRFAVNSEGYRFQSKGSDDLSWSRDWTVKTHKDDKSWTVEIAIPIASFGLTPLIKGEWGINLCRSNPKAAEYSCTAPVPKRGMYFHNVADYSLFKWDDPGVFKNYCCSIENLKLAAGGNGTLDLIGEVVNQTGHDLELVAQSEIAGRQLDSAKFAIRQGGTVNFSVSGYPDADFRDILAQVKLIDPHSKEVIAEHTARLIKSSLMDAVANRSFYTTENEAVIEVSLAIGQERLKGLELVCEIRGQDGKSVYTTRQPVSMINQILLVPLAKFPDGKFQAEIKLMSADKQQLAARTETIRKLPPKGGEVKIDRINRNILVDGKPFLPFAPLQVFHVSSSSPYGNYDEQIETLMKYWADNGFKAMVAGANVDKEKGKWGERIWDQVFKSAKNNNIKIIVFWTGPKETVLSNKEFLKSLIDRWKDESSLLAWMPVDEPEIGGVKPEEVAASIKFIQDLDPYHPTFINYTQMGPASRYAGLPGDIMSLDYYLTAAEGRTVKDTMQYVDVMQEVSAPMHVPVWNFIAGSNLDNHFREPSAGEQVAQTYGNIVKGVSGLMYFFGQLAGKKHWEAFKQLEHEIEELTPVILSGEQVPQVKSSNPSLLVMTRKYGASIYLFCVNIENRKFEISLDLGELNLPKNIRPGFWQSLFGAEEAIRANLIFEDRQVQCQQETLKDTFMPFERHIYQFEDKK